MAKKDVVDEIGLPVEAEVTEVAEVEQAEVKKSNKKVKLEVNGKVTTTPVDADEVDTKYPKSIPQGEGIDPLTSGVKIPNVG